MEKVICIMFNDLNANSKVVENRVNEHLKEGWVVKDFKVCNSAPESSNMCNTVFCFVLKK